MIMFLPTAAIFIIFAFSFFRLRRTAMFRLVGHRSEAIGTALAASRPALRRWLQTLLIVVFAAALPIYSASATTEEENYRVADDLGVYLGVLPAAMVRGHPKDHPEGGMHDGAPDGLHQYHIVVAIFDTRNGARIEEAKVTATVSGLGHVGTKTIELQPMAIAGTITYGNFVTLLGTDRYDIHLQISVPGRQHPVQVGFEYQHTR